MKLHQPKNLALVIKGLESADERVMVAAERGLRQALLITKGVVQKDYLSGPRPGKLDVRTTRLRNSITFDTTRDSDRIIGRLGSNVAYAAFHEFGFKGSVQVKAHTRIVAARTDKGVAIDLRERKAFLTKDRKFIGFKESAGAFLERRGDAGAVLQQSVKAHKRPVNYKGRPFVRPALLQREKLNAALINREIARALTPPEASNG